jgi:hypothetical protein
VRSARRVPAFLLLQSVAFAVRSIFLLLFLLSAGSDLLVLF